MEEGLHPTAHEPGRRLQLAGFVTPWLLMVVTFGKRADGLSVCFRQVGKQVTLTDLGADVRTRPLRHRARAPPGGSRVPGAWASFGQVPACVRARTINGSRGVPCGPPWVPRRLSRASLPVGAEGDAVLPTGRPESQ